MKFRYVFSILMVLSLLLASCGQPGTTPGATDVPGAATDVPAATDAPAADALKIAILAPMSGQVATFGQSTRDGAVLAIEEWNAKGGVLGRQIEFQVEDSQCSADAAVNAANKAINQDGIKFIIGEVCSGASIPISEIAEANGVLQISPTSTNPQVTLKQGGTKEYVFRACFTDAYQGEVQAKFALNNLEAKTAFVLFDQGNDYTVGLANFFMEAFIEGGGEIVGQETYVKEDTDFSTILTKVAAENPDILLIPDYYPIVNLIGAQAKQMGITATMLGGDGWDSPDLDPTAAEGGYFTNHYAPDEPRPIVANFVQAYEAKYGATPDALAALAYDAANMLLTSIQTANSDDPAVVKDAMASGTFDAVSGTITLDAEHNPIKTVTILQIVDGQVKFLTQVEP